MKIYTKDEAAKYLKISMTSLDDLLATGAIFSGKIGRQVIICEPHLDEYVIRIIQEQTEQRREAFQSGRKVHIVTAVGEVRKSRKDKPVLPELRAA